MVNNFANGSDTKELAAKMKDLEDHLYGRPRSNRSWHEFLMMLFLVVMVVGIVFKVMKKCIQPWIIKTIRKHAVKQIQKRRNDLTTVCGYVAAEQSRQERIKQLDKLTIKVNEHLSS